MAMVENIILLSLLLTMILLILILVFLACKPWRLLSSFHRPRPIKVDDLERPLVTEDSNQLPTDRNEPVKNYAPEATLFQPEGHFNSPGAHGLTYKQRLTSPATHLTQGGSLVLDINDQLVGQTLRRPFFRIHTEESAKEDLNYDSRSSTEDVKFPESISRESLHKGSCLSLEVITGPARGLCYTVRSTDASKLPVTLGRVPPSHFVLKDSEISGKHAMINWNLNLKWELVDMGSLNGTLLNSKAAHHPDTGSRNWGEPKELVDGDVITIGTTSQINVRITSLSESDIPFGLGIASDPMSMRRGAKKLPMEDVCYYRWPLPGVDQFGVFGICDGHGGALAAQSVSKILPETVATILSDSLRREMVLSRHDASDVLTDAFSETEACLNHYYEVILFTHI